jgi:hypothetical protein
MELIDGHIAEHIYFTDRLNCPNMRPFQSITCTLKPNAPYNLYNAKLQSLFDYVFLGATAHLVSSHLANFTVGLSTALQNKSATQIMIGKYNTNPASQNICLPEKVAFPKCWSRTGTIRGSSIVRHRLCVRYNAYDILPRYWAMLVVKIL